MEKIVSKAVIDKALFVKTIQVLAWHVSTKAIGEFQKKFKAWLLKMPSAKTILNHESNESEKYVLLSREYGSEVDKLPQNLREFLKENEIETKPFNLEIDYNNYTWHEALEKILPDGVMIPTGFETVGHIAHMNLGEEHADFKYQIGQIFLDKNPSIRTVLTKVGFIENVFRTFNFEVLAGEEVFETTLVEDNIKFDIDISKVYWCSRLGHERNRVVNDFFNPGDVVWDMFCGVGPLSVKAAKEKQLKVLANDLNPDCYHYLRRNICQNKVADLVIPFCMDGREFIKHLIDESNNETVLNKEEKKMEVSEKSGDKKKKKKNPTTKEEEAKLVPESEMISPLPNKSFLHFDHVYMNLPMDAVEFLDVFIGLFNKANLEIWDKECKPEGCNTGKGLPLIHVYGFTLENQDTDKAREFFVKRIGEVFSECGGFSEDQLLKFHNNRDVSRSSSMYCITFRLPYEVAYHPIHKRQKTDE